VSTPAGWYDDGSGRLRWWDGDQWTKHFADQQQLAVADTTGSTSAGLMARAKKAAGIGGTAATSEVFAVAEETPLYEVNSHIDGAKNAKVRLYQDRIEWERGRGVSGGKITAGVLTGGLSLLATGVKGGKDAYEMLPLKQITSVGNRKDGMLYHLVEVQTAGGTVGFRVSREDAASFRQAILTQMQTAAAAASAPINVQVAAAAAVVEQSAPSGADHVAQLQQLAQLRDAGILTEDEFASKKQEILSRI
jgi:hypothetical protein